MLISYLALIDSDENKQKFMRLYEQYKDLMYYVANGVLHDEHLAEDAVQEAFLRIARNFSKIGDVPCHQTRNFVVIIVRNVSLNILDTKKTF